MRFFISRLLPSTCSMLNVFFSLSPVLRSWQIHILKSHQHWAQSKYIYSTSTACSKQVNMSYCAFGCCVCALFSLQNRKCVAARWKDWQFFQQQKNNWIGYDTTLSVENASKASFHWKKVLLTCWIPLQNKQRGINLGNNVINWLWTCIFKQPDLTLNLFSWCRMCIFFYHLLIPNPIHGQWMEVSIILYFVKCDQTELEADCIMCISVQLFLSEVVSWF